MPNSDGLGGNVQLSAEIMPVRLSEPSGLFLQSGRLGGADFPAAHSALLSSAIDQKIRVDSPGSGSGDPVFPRVLDQPQRETMACRRGNASPPLLAAVGAKSPNTGPLSMGT